MPPKPGPPPRQVSRRPHPARGGSARSAASCSSCLIVFAIVKIAGRGSSTPPPTTAAVVQPKPFRIVFPEGFTRDEMAHRVQVVAKIAQRKSRTSTFASSSASYLRASHAAAGRRLRREEAQPRGLPLPGDVRLPGEHDVDAARAGPARRVPRELGEGRPELRAQEEPHAVRRADHRVARREGGARAGRAAEDRARHLQPAARAHESRDRRDDALRAARAGHEVADRSPSSRARTPTTRATRTSPGCRRRRSRIRGSPRCRRPRIPTAGNWLYFVRKRDKVHHYFTDNYNDFLNHERQYGY